jgi:hypothetical protein
MFRKIMVYSLRTQTQSVIFIGTCFTGRTNYIVVRYSVNYSGVKSNIRFCLQCNILTVSRM